jgi:hypothetical protein
MRSNCGYAAVGHLLANRRPENHATAFRNFCGVIIGTMKEGRFSA